MLRLIFLLISSTTIIHIFCDESNVNINNNDKQEHYSRKVDDDSLCENQVCRRIIIAIYCQNIKWRKTVDLFNFQSVLHVINTCILQGVSQLTAAEQDVFFFFLVSSITLQSFFFFLRGDGLYFYCLFFFFRYLFPLLPLCGRHSADETT